MITIYTDGACSGNPGKGGWGIVILEKDNEPVYLNGGDDNTTNNRMELAAAINALSYFNDTKEIKLITDSKYVKDGIQSWILNWKKNGWKTAAKKPVKNKDLWKLVRKNWDKVYNRNKDLELYLTVDDKRLFMYLFSLDPSEKNKSVKRIINYFVKS